MRPLASERRLVELPELLASLPSLGDDATNFAVEVDRARIEVGRPPERDEWER